MSDFDNGGFGDDGFEVDVPDEELSDGGNFLKADGSYHFAIHDILQDRSTKGNPLDGFTVLMEVLEGDKRHNGVCTEIGKLFNPVVWRPNLNHDQDSQERSRQQQSAFLVAANILTLEHVETVRQIKAAKRAGKEPPRLKVDLSRGVGQQVLMYVQTYDGKLKIHFSNIWHVDDPKASHIPKDEKALSRTTRLTAEQLQAIKDAFAGKATSGNGSASNGSGATQPQQPVGAGAGNVDLDDL